MPSRPSSWRCRPDEARPEPERPRPAGADADFGRSPTVKVRLLALFADDRVTTSDLWLLTSLLASHEKTPWFDKRLVLPHDADELHLRCRIADEIDRTWQLPRGPSAQPSLAMGTGTTVDAGVLEQWRSLLDPLLEAAPATRPRPCCASSR